MESEMGAGNRAGKALTVAPATVHSSPPQSSALQLTRLFSLRLGNDVLGILAAQALMATIAALVCSAIAGVAGLASALVGAAAYLAPNAAFALRLLPGLAGARQASALTFFVGELVKLAFVVSALALAGRFAGSWLVWPALLSGLCCVLMSYALLPLMLRLLRGTLR